MIKNINILLCFLSVCNSILIIDKTFQLINVKISTESIPIVLHFLTIAIIERMHRLYRATRKNRNHKGSILKTLL